MAAIKVIAPYVIIGYAIGMSLRAGCVELRCATCSRPYWLGRQPGNSVIRQSLPQVGQLSYLSCATPPEALRHRIALRYHVTLHWLPRDNVLVITGLVTSYE